MLQIGAAVAGLVLKDEADAAVTAAMNKNLKEYATDKPTQDAWAQIQVSQSIVSFTSRMLKCCGITDFKDWSNVTGVGPDNVPDSCCVTEAEGCGKDILKAEDNSQTLKHF